jgi:4-amino-4-deoxy-L-arabinose transferase-like glycosyltransferase
MAGIIGHDPWKQDETYSFGIIYHFYTTHTWLVPTNAGMPFMEKPPLYYWTAVVFCKLFSGLLPLHDAARLASPFYMLITVLFMLKISQTLFKDYSQRRDMGWISIVLVLASAGMVRHAHDMFTDVALLTGTTIALYGMALLVKHTECWKSAGIWLGFGIGIAFLSKGLFVPAILGASFLAAFLMFPAMRTKRTIYAVLLALLTALPFLILWPLLLYRHSHELFIEWLWNNNIGRFLGFSVGRLGADNKKYYFLYTILWFSFPGFFLACINAFYNRRQWRKAEYLLPVSVFAIGFVMLLVSASGRALYLIPLLPACALMATPGLYRIHPRFLYYWNIAVQALSGICIILMLFTWFSLLQSPVHQPIPAFSQWVEQVLPLGFITHGNQSLFYLTTLISIAFWSCSLRMKKDIPENTARIWLSAMLAIWGISHSLLLPWIDETKSYRPVLESMNEFLAHSPYARDCIGNHSLGESISPMLQYYSNQHIAAPNQDFDDNTCPLLLLTTKPHRTI